MGILGSLHDSRKLLTSNLYHITSHTPTSEFDHLENPHGVTKITLAERKKRKFAICTFVLRLTGVHDNGAHFRTVSCLSWRNLPPSLLCLPFLAILFLANTTFLCLWLPLTWRKEKNSESMTQEVNLPPLVSSGLQRLSRVPGQYGRRKGMRGVGRACVLYNVFSGMCSCTQLNLPRPLTTMMMVLSVLDVKVPKLGPALD